MSKIKLKNNRTDNLHFLTCEVVGMSEELTHSAQDLSEMAQELQKLVEEFEV
ncbi:hypothetical protein [Acetohalobium arabaticum]|uniref:hypothetical protein n=1 Tax=Acetohalobium arabaticum TaxID=28187 RepID=UPI0002F303D3|nr:hypothetical protein [Acetohalobium arabaticum]